MSKQQDQARPGRAASPRVRLVALSLALIAVLLVGGTLAYLTNRGSGDMAFAVSGTTSLRFEGGFLSSDGTGIAVQLLPGDLLTTSDTPPANKRIAVENTGNTCYLLVRLRFAKSATERLAREDLDRAVATLYNGATAMDTREALMSSSGYVTVGVDKYEATAGAADAETSGVWLLKNKFRNMTTAADYAEGVLTFMYQDTVPAGSVVNLVDCIGAPTDWASGLGECIVTGWAESVPAADYASVDAAYTKLTEVHKASDYYLGSA